jgi:hypothetical protein
MDNKWNGRNMCKICARRHKSNTHNCVYEPVWYILVGDALHSLPRASAKYLLPNCQHICNKAQTYISQCFSARVCAHRCFLSAIWIASLRLCLVVCMCCLVVFCCFCVSLSSLLILGARGFVQQCLAPCTVNARQTVPPKGQAKVQTRCSALD